LRRGKKEVQDHSYGREKPGVFAQALKKERKKKPPAQRKEEGIYSFRDQPEKNKNVHFFYLKKRVVKPDRRKKKKKKGGIGQHPLAGRS